MDFIEVVSIAKTGPIGQNDTFPLKTNYQVVTIGKTR